MRYKATFITGFIAGYVLGAKAGRERYDAIAQTARGMWEMPAVQETAGVLQAQAAGAVDTAKRKVTDAVGGKFGPLRGASTAAPMGDGGQPAPMAYPTGAVMPEGGALD
jgi:hypothetical protein